MQHAGLLGSAGTVCVEREAARPIPAGYYHAGDRQKEDIALHYISDGSLEVLLDRGRRIIADLHPDDPCRFVLRIDTKTLKFVYRPESAALIKETNAAGGMRFDLVALWPVCLARERMRDMCAAHACLRDDMHEHGVAAIRDVFKGRMAVLQQLHETFLPKASSNASKTIGWFSFHEDYDAEPSEMLLALLAPISGLLDLLLGCGNWEHDSSLQVGFAGPSKVLPDPR